MPDEARREIMMPVPQQDAAIQFFVEAMKSNTTVLRELRNDMKEDRKLLNDVHLRVVRIESNRVDGRVSALETEVSALKQDRDQREGANQFAKWLLKNLPAMAAIVVAIVSTVIITLSTTRWIR